MLGTKIYKDKFDNEKYANCANWCNENNAMIEDKGEYYEVVTIPAPSLDELKQSKLTELKTIRDNEEVKPIEYNGNLFDFDNKARDRINSAIIALDVQTAQTKATAVIDWTTADNQDVKVTADDLRMIIASVANRSNALHVAYRAAKDKVEAATTVTEIEAVTLNL